MAACADILSRHQDDWKGAVTHPFLTAVQDGTIQAQQFDAWLGQCCGPLLGVHLRHSSGCCVVSMAASGMVSRREHNQLAPLPRYAVQDGLFVREFTRFQAHALSKVGAFLHCCLSVRLLLEACSMAMCPRLGHLSVCSQAASPTSAPIPQAPAAHFDLLLSGMAALQDELRWFAVGAGCRTASSSISARQLPDNSRSTIRTNLPPRLRFHRT